MKVLEILLCLLVIIFNNPVFCKVYKFDVHSKMAKRHRIWRGMSSNTGNNFGGWLVYIKNNNDATIVCGGAYYAPLLIITSANCIHPYTYVAHITIEPTAKMQSDQYFGQIDTVYYPEQFTYLDQYMDVALVRLNKPIKGKLMEFIGLCDGPIMENTELTSIGWGFDSMDVQPMSLVPTNSTVVKENINKCASRERRRVSYNTIFCATLPVDSRKCRYDGGCPIIYKNQLCGIVSWGPQCKDTSEPGIFTNISLVKSWIQKIEKQVNSSY